MSPNKQCKTLVALLGAARVIFPGGEGYTDNLASYHSPQAAAVQPACFVAPQTVSEVSKIVKSLSSACRDDEFAVRGGGHMWFTGSNNIQDGVTIDLRGLDDISLNGGGRDNAVDIGAGATWDQVYEFLEPYGLSVAGGRAAGVGVGGLSLGGGISYFGPRQGWTSNQITSFEVVLANGSVVIAGERENKDLWIGLRGGLSNFGIVTRMTLRTFAQPDLLWYSLRLSPSTETDAQASIFGELMDKENYDENASFFTGWVYIAAQDLTLVQSELVYTRPWAGQVPSFYEPALALTELEGSTTIVANSSTLAQNSLAFRPPQASRYMTATTTFIASEDMIQASYNAFDLSTPLVKDIPGISWSIVLEPLPPSLYTRYGAKKNSLGLDQASETLVVFLISAAWSDAAHDQQVYSAAAILVENIENKAKSLAAYAPFVYANYAAPWQDVIQSYGTENVRKLRRLRDKVDPQHFFTNKLKGGFKIP